MPAHALPVMAFTPKEAFMRCADPLSTNKTLPRRQAAIDGLGRIRC